jgi:hypothetical protein
MDYTYREPHGEAIYRFNDGMLPTDFLPPQRRARLPRSGAIEAARPFGNECPKIGIGGTPRGATPRTPPGIRVAYPAVRLG